MIRAMRWGTWVFAAVVSAWTAGAQAQCAPAPDSSYFFRNLTQQRADAKLAEDRAFFEKLLSTTFANRAAFIDGELTPDREHSGKVPAEVRDFSLLEHRKGFVVTSYQLVAGKTGLWFRDVYQVEDGKWRLASTEPAPPLSNPRKRTGWFGRGLSKAMPRRPTSSTLRPP